MAGRSATEMLPAEADWRISLVKASSSQCVEKLSEKGCE